MTVTRRLRQGSEGAATKACGHARAPRTAYDPSDLPGSAGNLGMQLDKPSKSSVPRGAQQPRGTDCPEHTWCAGQSHRALIMLNASNPRSPAPRVPLARAHFAPCLSSPSLTPTSSQGSLTRSPRPHASFCCGRQTCVNLDSSLESTIRHTHPTSDT